MNHHSVTDYQSRSWWLESLPETIVPNPVLPPDQTADVVVIGGGYTGLSTGWHLKQMRPGMDVRIIQKKMPILTLIVSNGLRWFITVLLKTIGSFERN